MRFFLDENFPKAAHTLLMELGHQVFDLRGTPEQGLPDREIFLKAQHHGAVFLTTDRDFFHTIPHLYQTHSGIVVIALRQPSRQAILEKLSWILNRLQPHEFANRTIQLRDRTWISVPSLEVGP